MSRNPSLKLDDFLPYLVNRVGAGLVERFSREALAEGGLTIDMWRVLVRLADSGAQRQIDLASATSIEASTVSRIVTRLVKRGLVTRSRSKTSSREVVIDLAAKGRALVKKLIPVALDLERAAAAGITTAELARLKQILRKIYGNLAGQ
jgi:MarR family transcriptional regulator, organic hydroperoxide resistance regulator